MTINPDLTMNSMIHDYWNMSPLAAVGAIILMCCVLGKWEGWMKTAGCVVGGAPFHGTTTITIQGGAAGYTDFSHSTKLTI